MEWQEMEWQETELANGYRIRVGTTDKVSRYDAGNLCCEVYAQDGRLDVREQGLSRQQLDELIAGYGGINC